MAGVEEWDHDVVVVGSGFGGSVTALRLTEKGWSVGVIEAGRRFTPAHAAQDQLAAQPLPVGASSWACAASTGSTAAQST